MNSSLKTILKLDWCSHDAALYAVKHWHYSKSLPCSKTARIGVWEVWKVYWCYRIRMGREQPSR